MLKKFFAAFWGSVTIGLAVLLGLALIVAAFDILKFLFLHAIH